MYYHLAIVPTSDTNVDGNQNDDLSSTAKGIISGTAVITVLVIVICCIITACYCHRYIVTYVCH